MGKIGRPQVVGWNARVSLLFTRKCWKHLIAAQRDQGGLCTKCGDPAFKGRYHGPVQGRAGSLLAEGICSSQDTAVIGAVSRTVRTNKRSRSFFSGSSDSSPSTGNQPQTSPNPFITVKMPSQILVELILACTEGIYLGTSGTSYWSGATQARAYDAMHGITPSPSQEQVGLLTGQTDRSISHGT